ncbi:MAG: hypothetical protein GY856_46655, partial [bacterium]|nr:hypothetical protein [bacterium]
MGSSKSKSPAHVGLTWLALIAITGTGLGRAAAEQIPAPVLSAKISLGEWGIADPSSIRLGRLGIAQEPEGERLHAYVLRSDARRELVVETSNAKPRPAGNCFVVAELSGGNQNRLGGYFNVFQRAPSSARFDIDRRGHGRRTLQLSYHRAASGFCGFWMHFYDFVREEAGPRSYLDAGDFGILSLWARGREGGERLLLKLADRRLDRLGDSLAVGELGAATPSGVLTTEWQRSVVSLHDLPPALDRAHLASLALEATEGRGAVEVSRIALCRNAADLPPLPATGPPATTARKLSKALWVWNTRELMDRPEQRAEFLSFLDTEG